MNRDVMRRSVQRLSNLAQQPHAAGWYRVVRNEAPDTPTRVDIYDEIGGGSWFSTGVSAVDFIAEIAQITGDLEVHLNSPGGDVFDGLAIYNSLAQRPGRVTTIVDGLAASAASFIAMAGTTRLICPGAMMMIHEASGFCVGNAAEMRETADLLDKVSENLAAIYASHSGRADGWRDAMHAETWYTADEAVAAGLAHRLAERPAELAAVASFDLSVFAHVPERIRNAAQPQKPAKTVACPGCQTDNDEDANYCDQCGEPMPDGDGAENAGRSTVAASGAAPVVNKALPIHHTATVDEPWDGPAAVAAMPNDDTVLRYCHAWESSEAAAEPHRENDNDADDQKANYKFPHHKTKGGPANLAACRNGLARLEGSSIPEGDKAGVRAHLQAHLDDARGNDDGDTADNSMPAWLTNQPAPMPAWLNSAKEAQ